MLQKNHAGRHKFTPSYLLSPSTITKILLELTSGEIKSRAGLDNTDVIKGHENFEAMRVMVDNLCSIIGSDNEIENAATHLKNEINKVEEFHKVNFIRHLEKGSSKCMCLKCGFTDNSVDPIQCNQQHTPPCKDCQNGFQVS